MLKVAYIVPKTSIEKNFPGINKKIEMQINAFEFNNIDVRILDNTISEKCIWSKIERRLPFGKVSGKWSFDEGFEDIDCIYIRYISSDYKFIKWLKNIKQTYKNIKIVIEVPTYPYEKEKKININNFMIIAKDLYNRRKLYKYVDRIATYSDDEKIFNIQTINISNGIDFNMIKIKDGEEITIENEDINIIAVATFAKWHGYDRAINGIKSYYDNGGQRNIRLHLVGDGEELEEYKKMVDEYKLHNNIQFYGKKIGKELDYIYNKCNIALDAMGRHRSGVFFNSSIKGKEYSAKGLPIISGVKTELDKEKFKYYYRINADESFLNIDELISFYEDIYPIGKDKRLIYKEIRNFSKIRFDINECIKPIIDYIKK